MQCNVSNGIKYKLCEFCCMDFVALCYRTQYCPQHLVPLVWYLVQCQILVVRTDDDIFCVQCGVSKIVQLALMLRASAACIVGSYVFASLIFCNAFDYFLPCSMHK